MKRALKITDSHFINMDKIVQWKIESEKVFSFEKENQVIRFFLNTDEYSFECNLSVYLITEEQERCGIREFECKPEQAFFSSSEFQRIKRELYGYMGIEENEKN